MTKIFHLKAVTFPRLVQVPETPNYEGVQTPPAPCHHPRLRDAWGDPSMKIVFNIEKEEVETDFVPVEKCWLAGIRESALTRTPWLAEFVEFLPIKCLNSSKYVAFNVNQEFDLFDPAPSTYLPPMEHHQRFGSHPLPTVFWMDPSPVAGRAVLFRMPQFAEMYCTGEMLSLFEESNTSGWRARQVFPPLPEAYVFEERGRLLWIEDQRRPKIQRPGPHRQFGDKSLRILPDDS